MESLEGDLEGDLDRILIGCMRERERDREMMFGVAERIPIMYA